MSACCEFARHVWGWVAYHSGHRPKAMSTAMASLQLYPPTRQVKAEPLKKEQKR